MKYKKVEAVDDEVSKVEAVETSPQTFPIYFLIIETLGGASTASTFFFSTFFLLSKK
jgi:hypothetical protein